MKEKEFILPKGLPSCGAAVPQDLGSGQVILWEWGGVGTGLVGVRRGLWPCKLFPFSICSLITSLHP